MKLLVFAHTPPPHHGQSYMVQLMLEGFGGDCRRRSGRTTSATGYGIDCYHVNAQLSKELEDIGDIRPAKLLLLLGYCAQAIWMRFRHGVTNLYYVPAPGKYSAIYRDWIVMLLCRPFFKKIILHWHAAGLAKWLETAVQMRTRSLTFRLMKHADLSIILSEVTKSDPEKLFSRRIRVVGNGIPDPCPDFDQSVLPGRRARLAARCQLLARQPPATGTPDGAGGDARIFKVLYLAHCTREKGLFDAAEAVLQANRKLAASGFPISMQLLVAGGFLGAHERAEFDEILARPETGQSIRYLGFVAGEQKLAALREADAFCFPTYYDAESFGLVVVEAMAFGLPIVATHWRSIPGLLPPDYPGLVKIRSPQQVADALLGMMTSNTGESLRAMFLRDFIAESFLRSLAEAFHSIESDGQPDLSGRLVPAAAP
jgi:glycosyltransferase involved in cell wall biosynthesis